MPTGDGEWGPASRKSQSQGNNAEEGNIEPFTRLPGTNIFNPGYTAARGAHLGYCEDTGRGHPKTRTLRIANRRRRVGGRQAPVMQTLASAGRKSWICSTTTQGDDPRGDVNRHTRIKTESGSATPPGCALLIASSLHDERAATAGRERDRVGAAPITSDPTLPSAYEVSPLTAAG